MISCPLTSGTRTYTGTARYSQLEPDLTAGPTGSGSSFYGTEISLTNDNGWLECFLAAVPIPKLAVGGGTSLIFGPSQLDLYRGGSARNNDDYSRSGDPRALNEQLDFIVYTSSGDFDQTRFFNSTDSLTTKYLGYPNSNFIQPAGNRPWGDYYDWPSANDPAPNPTAATAPGVIANAQLTSIGQLGDLYDPTRLPPAASSSIQYSRGGGRTLRIGQSEASPALYPLWDGQSGSLSQQWAAWRLADVFGIEDTVQSLGRINLNGINRDNGAALRAALYGFKFQTSPDGASQLSGQTLNVDTNTDSPGLQKIIEQLKARLADPIKVRSGNWGTLRARYLWGDRSRRWRQRPGFWQRHEYYLRPGPRGAVSSHRRADYDSWERVYRVCDGSVRAAN